jgi:hypothetical protein
MEKKKKIRHLAFQLPLPPSLPLPYSQISHIPQTDHFRHILINNQILNFPIYPPIPDDPGGQGGRLADARSAHAGGAKGEKGQGGGKRTQGRGSRARFECFWGVFDVFLCRFLAFLGEVYCKNYGFWWFLL